MWGSQLGVFERCHLLLCGTSSHCHLSHSPVHMATAKVSSLALLPQGKRLADKYNQVAAQLQALESGQHSDLPACLHPLMRLPDCPRLRFLTVSLEVLGDALRGPTIPKAFEFGQDKEPTSELVSTFYCGALLNAAYGLQPVTTGGNSTQQPVVCSCARV